MYKQLATWALLILAALPATSAEQEFLKPDQAFVMSALALDDERLQVEWRIADGYYMYQSKFRFRTDTPSAEFGDPRLPQAVTKKDPIFGEVEVYRGQVRIELPFHAGAANTEALSLIARSQGCAEDGICYPPHTQTLQLI